MGNFDVYGRKDLAMIIKPFEDLRNNLREASQRWCEMYGGIEKGDFSYGAPRACCWNEGATHMIEKFCSIAAGITIMVVLMHW